VKLFCTIEKIIFISDIIIFMVLTREPTYLPNKFTIFTTIGIE
jgi:hypothetical protein